MALQPDGVVTSRDFPPICVYIVATTQDTDTTVFTIYQNVSVPMTLNDLE